MTQDRQYEDVQSLVQRLQRLESLAAHRTKRSPKIDSDSPFLPSMDDFNFSEDEFANFDKASGAVEWTAPFRFPNGNSRGLMWDSGSGGSLFVNSSVGFIEETGDLLSFVDAMEPEPTSIDTAYRFVKTHYRFYYRHPERGGKLQITATFSIRNAHIRDAVQGGAGDDSAIDFLEFQNLRIAAYRQCGDAWERFGKVIDEYHEMAWDIRWNTKPDSRESYDHNRPEGPYEVVLTSSGELSRQQLTKFYVGTWSGLTLSADACAYATFNRFDVRLDKVRAELI